MIEGDRRSRVQGNRRRRSNGRHCRNRYLKHPTPKKKNFSLQLSFLGPRFSLSPIDLHKSLPQTSATVDSINEKWVISFSCFVATDTVSQLQSSSRSFHTTISMWVWGGMGRGGGGGVGWLLSHGKREFTVEDISKHVKGSFLSTEFQRKNCKLRSEFAD